MSKPNWKYCPASAVLSILFILNFSSFLLSYDGWELKNSGTTNNLYSVHFSDQEKGWIVGKNGTLLKTTDGGDNWYSVQINHNLNIYSVFFVDSLVGWISGYRNNGPGFIFKTNDGGSTWDTVYTAEYSSVNSIYFVNPDLGWAGCEVSYPYGSYFGLILKTVNGGVNWQQNSSYMVPLRSIYFLNANLGWATGYNDMIGALYPPWTDINRTQNGGQSWVSCILADTTYTYYRSIDFVDSLHGFVCGRKYDYLIGYEYGLIRKSIDGGATWIPMAGGTFSSLPLTDIKFFNTDTGYISGYRGKIFKTYNGGINWQKQYTGTNVSLNALYFWDVDTGWAVGNNGVILKTTTGGVTSLSSDEQSILPDDMMLFSNYPNPFNSETTIEFYLPQTSEIKIENYNLLGQKVRTLWNGRHPAGQHQLNWDGRDEVGREVASGVYICRLNADRRHQYKKLVLIR